MKQFKLPSFNKLVRLAVLLVVAGPVVAHLDGGQGAETRKRNIHEERAAWFHSQRAFPLDDIPEGARSRALEQIKKAKGTRRLSVAGGLAGGIGLKWFPLGPAPIVFGELRYSGRVTAVAVDPADQEHWLIGAAQGGIWETWDAGGTWAPRTDDQPSLAMGAMAFAPSNPKIIYAGTGEANFAAVCYAGMGLLKSIDRGTNWFLLAETQFSRSAFSDIKVHRTDPKILMAATTRGIMGRAPATPPSAPSRGVFKSIDGGTNWSQKLWGEATDLEIDPDNFSRQYAALGEIHGAATNGVYRSTTAGDSWMRIDGPWAEQIAIINVGRIEMAIAPTYPKTLYVSVAFKVDTSGNPLHGVWRTDNAWDPTPDWTDITGGLKPNTGRQLWFYHELTVHPTDPGILFFGGLGLFKFEGGGWSSIQYEIHDDQHALAWANTPSGLRLISGNDGGVWSRLGEALSWDNHNATLALTQFYEGSVHPTDPDLALGGTQDNGTELFTGDLSWTHIYNYDGCDNAISASQPNTHWALSTQTGGANSDGVSILRTKNAGKGDVTVVSYDIDTSLENAPFCVRFEKHPTLDDLFIAGTDKLWRCDNFFTASIPSWTPNSPALLTSGGEPVKISALAFAPSDAAGQTYAYGTRDGQLRITSNGGNKWTDLDPANAVPNRAVTDLAFDPADSDVLYVTLSGFDEGTPSAPGHVFKTMNALAATPGWTDVSPPVNLPANTIVAHPLSTSQLYVGTDMGVWHSNDGGESWSHLGPETGMPNVAVFELQTDSSGTVTAFTHGRGAFVLTFDTSNIIVPKACKPPCHHWIHPGDLITFEFPLKAIITRDTVNLTARLRPTQQITPLSGPQTYGALKVNGPSVQKPFTFMAGGGVGGQGAGLAGAGSRCGDLVHAFLDLEDQGRSLGSVAFPFRLGRPSLALSEDLERLTPPELPPNWRASLVGTGTPWASTSNAPPNLSPATQPEDVSDLPHPGLVPPNVSLFAPAPDGTSENVLDSAPIPITTDSAQLSFRHSFDFEEGTDGGVLEISIGGAPFVDIERALGSFADNGYSTFMGRGSPLSGRQAWSGNSGGYFITRVNLPASARGQNIQLRWRCATDDRVGGGGWFVDDLQVEEFQCLTPVRHPVIVRPRVMRDRFSFSFATVSGRTYLVECKGSWSDPRWELVETVAGDGTEKTTTLPTVAEGQRFYRFRVE